MSMPGTTTTPLRHTAHTAVAVLLAITLAGCAALGNGSRNNARATIYAPDPRVQADPGWPAVQWQLLLSTPTATRAIDGFGIAVRPTPDELQVYRGASWAKTPTDMLQDTLLRALEDSGKIPAVARQGAGIAPDYRLLLDLRRFEADYGGRTVPEVVIEVSAKLIHGRDQSVVGSHTFRHAQTAASVELPQVVEAYSRALEHTARDLAAWTLNTGHAHRQVP